MPDSPVVHGRKTAGTVHAAMTAVAQKLARRGATLKAANRRRDEEATLTTYFKALGR